MAADVLVGAEWECAAVTPGAAESPRQLDDAAPTWWPAVVPGTVAAALRRAGLPPDVVPDLPGATSLDDADWWFRCRFRSSAADGAMQLELGGLATLADVWIDERHLLHSEDMFVAHRVVVPGEPVAAGADGDRHELVIRCAALTPVLARRRPRPRWKTYLVSHQNLRWVRTSLLGRQAGRATSPPPVGPWRPVRLVPLAGPALVDRHVVATCVGAGGQVRVRVRLRRAATTTEARLHVGDVSGTLSLTDEGDVQVAHGVLRLPTVERWWPHTHGDQRLYPVALVVDGSKVDLGKVGFRTVDADRADDGFSLRVNGEPVFCRGACWTPIDPVSLVAPPGEPRATLEAARRAGMNMVRIPGTTAYEDDDFWDLCDELGILVWQDCMLAYYDPPQDAGFEAAVEAELEGVFSHLSGRPSLTVVCGGQETEAQPAMLGLARHTWECPLQLKLIPALVERILPGTPYVSSNPSGGALPFQMNAGVAHYFGVGAYLRPVADARRAGVRFATECLAFAAPPPRRTVDEVFGGPVAAAWDPAWKLAVHYDAGRSWDSEDMQGYYVRVLFGVDAFESRYRDPDRAMDLNRATVATVMERVLTEWRRPGSTCSGALVLALRDHHPGAGWGVIDSLGRPKAPWFALRRVFSPLALLLTDEELNGLQAHVVNDGARPFRGSLAVRAFSRGELPVEDGTVAVEVAERAATTIEVADLFDGFRDVTAAYGFGPPAFDVVALELRGDDGGHVADAVHLPLGLDRPVEPDVGLAATVVDVAPEDGGGRWSVDVSTRRFAQWVEFDVPGFEADDSWFHLAPGATRRVGLRRVGGDDPGTAAGPDGTIRAFNAVAAARVACEVAS